MYNVRYKSRSFVVKSELAWFLVKVAHELTGYESRETLAAAVAVNAGGPLSEKIRAVIQRAYDWDEAAAA